MCKLRVLPLPPPLVWQHCCDVITHRKFLIKLVGKGDKAEGVIKL